MNYTGVGSRDTPSNILNLMTNIAKVLSKKGFTLRSGGAKGADTSFELGAADSEIFYAKDCTPQAMDIASKIHPNWGRCSDYAKRLHGRNVFQILGKDLNNPSAFLICWTKGGKSIGGTRTAIILAEDNNIPVYNLGKKDDLVRLKQFLSTL